MDLWINVINNYVFNSLDSLLFTDNTEIAKWIGNNFSGELEEELSPQYEIQVKSQSELRKKFGKDIFNKIEGIYWGTEQCEWLLPTVNETKKAIESFFEFNKTHSSHKKLRFVFLTPYWGSSIIKKRLIENLEYLNDNTYKINKGLGKLEVVVNDLGTLELIKEYKNLIPSFGRLLCKQLKMPLVDELGLEDNIKIPGNMMKNKSEEEIKELRKMFAKNQMKVLGRSALHTSEFIDFSKEFGVSRFGIDYNERYSELYEDQKKDLDIYYPYGIVFVGRLCDTSGIKNVKRGYYPIDEPCPKTCELYDLCIKGLQQTKSKLFQRGNAQYKSNISLENLKGKILFDKINENRLIYTPML